MSRFTFHIVYITRLEGSSKFYIGKHSTDNIEDGYVGSGVWVKKCKKSGLQLTREVLACFDNEVDAYRFEEGMVDAFMFDSPDCLMNFKRGGRGGWKGVPKTPEHRAKIGEANRRREFWATRKWIRCKLTGRVFHGCRAAAEHFGVGYSTITDMLNGYKPQSKRIQIEYIENPTP